MGTNYYLYPRKNASEEEKLHIGLSSHGWCFQLHVIPEKGIHGLRDWELKWRHAWDADMGAWARLKRLLNSKKSFIYDEYGRKISPKDMHGIITQRKGTDDWSKPSRRFPEYQDEVYFHNMNYSMRGPSGLLRSRIAYDCVGHGAGTWDLIQGEFS